MKKRGRKKKVVTSIPQSENPSVADQDGPVLDLEKSIIKKLIRKGKKDGYLTNELIKKSFPEDKFTSEQIEQYTTKLSEVGFDIIDSDDSDNPIPNAPNAPKNIWRLRERNNVSKLEDDVADKPRIKSKLYNYYHWQIIIKNTPKIPNNKS